MKKVGVVHNDIKPANIMFDTKEGKNVYLIDFGLASKSGDKNLNGSLIYTDPRVIISI